MTNGLPFVSVVMPVRNEAGFIARSLDCVLTQDYPHERLEIIVADGCSTDTTREIIRSLQSAHPNLRLIDNPGRIAPTGLNAAIAQAKGSVIVRVDGHCEIAPNYVRRCVEHLEHDNVECVGGPLETVGQTKTARAIAAAMSSPFGVGGSAFRTVKDKTMLTDTVAFPAFKRSIIERAGPFDDELVRNQDDEYSYRLRKLGAKILLAADVQARYYSRGSLRTLCRQYFQYGYWKVRVLQKHPRQMRLRQFVPAVFVTALAAALLISFFDRRPSAFILGSYLSANLTASLLTAHRLGWSYFPLLPPVFASLHFSYGLGFMVGLVKFARHWREAK